MTPSSTSQAEEGYTTRRAWVENYFDRTASDAWARLTSDAPVSGVRATVRAGRDRMRATLLSWLPEDLSGCRVLDAGCGPGQMSIALARRGADVLAIDLSKTLTDLARERLPADIGPGRVTFVAGDMLDPALGHFDHVVAMDSLIHYQLDDMVGALAALATRADRSIVFTFAPKTLLLTAMHTVGRLFPRSDRAPSIEPVAEKLLRMRLANETGFDRWQAGRSERVENGFYKSQAFEIEAG